MSDSNLGHARNGSLGQKRHELNETKHPSEQQQGRHIHGITRARLVNEFSCC